MRHELLRRSLTGTRQAPRHPHHSRRHPKQDMTEPDQFPRHSPLCQSVTRDGKTVRIEIYKDGEGAWLLEVVDDFGNSTVWDDPFASDQEALDEVLRTIDEEGIDSLIGSPPDGQPEMGLDQPLSSAEFDELDDFLADEGNEDTSMDVSTLEGFLTAIAIGPHAVPPSDWLPWVWDMKDGEVAADFASEAQASRIMSLILRHYNHLVHTFNTDPASFEPIFWRGVQWGAAEWSEGFITAFMFNEAAWSLLSIAHPTWFTPFLRLSTDEGIDITDKTGDAETWMNKIEPALVRIHAYWKEKRGIQPARTANDDDHHRVPKEIVPIVRDGPKIGRNDPCPCGSGKKFKKCCGADGAPSSLH